MEDLGPTVDLLFISKYKRQLLDMVEELKELREAYSKKAEECQRLRSKVDTLQAELWTKDANVSDSSVDKEASTHLSGLAQRLQLQAREIEELKNLKEKLMSLAESAQGKLREAETKIFELEEEVQKRRATTEHKADSTGGFPHTLAQKYIEMHNTLNQKLEDLKGALETVKTERYNVLKRHLQMRTQLEVLTSSLTEQSALIAKSERERQELCHQVDTLSAKLDEATQDTLILKQLRKEDEEDIANLSERLTQVTSTEGSLKALARNEKALMSEGDPRADAHSPAPSAINGSGGPALTGKKRRRSSTPSDFEAGRPFCQRNDSESQTLVQQGKNSAGGATLPNSGRFPESGTDIINADTGNQGLAEKDAQKRTGARGSSVQSSITSVPCAAKIVSCAQNDPPAFAPAEPRPKTTSRTAVHTSELARLVTCVSSPTRMNNNTTELETTPAPHTLDIYDYENPQHQIIPAKGGHTGLGNDENENCGLAESCPPVKEFVEAYPGDMLLINSQKGHREGHLNANDGCSRADLDVLPVCASERSEELLSTTEKEAGFSESTAASGVVKDDKSNLKRSTPHASEDAIESGDAVYGTNQRNQVKSNQRPYTHEVPATYPGQSGSPCSSTQKTIAFDCDTLFKAIPL